MQERDEIDMNDEITKFCVSTIAQNVAKVGIDTVVKVHK